MIDKKFTPIAVTEFYKYIYIYTYTLKRQAWVKRIDIIEYSMMIKMNKHTQNTIYTSFRRQELLVVMCWRKQIIVEESRLFCANNSRP